MILRSALSRGRVAFRHVQPVTTDLMKKRLCPWCLSPWSSKQFSVAASMAKMPEGDNLDPKLEQFVSWVDAMEFDEETIYGPDYSPLDKLPEDTAAESTLKLTDASDSVLQALTKLGVQSEEDVKFVTEGDLLQCGIPAVMARKFLFKYNAQLITTPKPAALVPAPAPGTLGLFDPQDTMKSLAKKGSASGERPYEQILASSFLGGALLGWGCALTVTVAGGASGLLVNAPGLQSLLAGAIFPAGLSMVLLSGSELLTGNFVTMALPAWTHPGMPKTVIRYSTWKVWTVSGIGNLLGSLFLAGSVYAFSIVTQGSIAATWLCALTAKKCSLPLATMLGKAAGANWLVNVAIFQASSAHTTAGKIASLWIPIMTFVALGLEHSIANMFLLPLGWMLGADVTLLQVAGNIIPVAVGNAIGAIIFVAGIQRYSLLKSMVHISKK